jgi:hypothetical protein
MLIGENSEKYDPHRQKFIEGFDLLMAKVIRCFMPITRLSLLCHEKLAGTHPSTTKCSELQKHAKIIEKEFDLEHELSQGPEIFAIFDAMSKSISLIMNGHMRTLKNKRFEFEDKLPPEEIVPLIVEVMSKEDHLPKDVVNGACMVLRRFTLLDLHKDFGYPSERMNPYFTEECKYFNQYAQKLT